MSGLPVAVVATSYEVRWFFDGDVPNAVADVMRAPGTGPVESPYTATAWPPPRTDRYLSFAADMGIKHRQERDRPGHLEFKGRQRLDGLVSLAPGVTGVASTWIKWSYPAQVVPAALREACAAGGPSVAVEKARFLRRFRLDPGEPSQEVDLGASLARGVQLELTRLRVPIGHQGSAPTSAWTVSFEGFPLSPGLESAVHAALAEPLEALAAAGAALDEQHSASYPEWLLSLSPRQRP